MADQKYDSWNEVVSVIDLPQDIEELAKERYIEALQRFENEDYEDLNLNRRNIARGSIYQVSTEKGDPITSYELLSEGELREFEDNELLSHTEDLQGIDTVFQYLERSEGDIQHYHIPSIIDGEPEKGLVNKYTWNPEGLKDFSYPDRNIAQTRDQLVKESFKNWEDVIEMVLNSDLHGRTDLRSLEAATVYLSGRDEGLTQDQVSDASDVSVSTIVRWSQRLKDENLESKT